MGDDTGVRRLVEMLSAFFTENRAVEEDLTCSLTSEFLRNMQDVLFAKQILAFSRWRTFFNASCDRMFRSSELFIRYVIYACVKDTAVVLHTIEKFLHAFATILRLSLEALHRQDLNFCKLVPDIFFVLYETKLKRSFRKCGGLRRLVEYVNNSKYLESNCVVRNISTFYDFSVSDFGISTKSGKKVLILETEEELPKTPDFGDVERDDDISGLVMKVLKVARIDFFPKLPDENLDAEQLDLNDEKTRVFEEAAKIIETSEKAEALKETLQQCLTSNFESIYKSVRDITGDAEHSFKAVKRLTLLSDPYLSMGQVPSRKKRRINSIEGGRVIETDAKIETLHAVSSSNSDSVTNFTAERKEDNAWYENIIEAVIRHNNHTESSGPAKSASRIRTEADEILRDLKNKIKSLIEVLDECDKECFF